MLPVEDLHLMNDEANSTEVAKDSQEGVVYLRFRASSQEKDCLFCLVDIYVTELPASIHATNSKINENLRVMKCVIFTVDCLTCTAIANLRAHGE